MISSMNFYYLGRAIPGFGSRSSLCIKTISGAFQFHALPVKISEVGNSFFFPLSVFSQEKTVCSDVLLGDKLLRNDGQKRCEGFFYDNK
jgi:hypothetical protein